MQRNDNVIKILSDLVAIDSQSQKGNVQIIDFLSQLFGNYSQTTQSWVREDGVKGKNLIVKIPGKSSDQSLVFVCHMDTVPTSSAWETDPFILEENGGNLYGLGACDTKGGIASLIEAILTLSEKPAYDTYILFDGDEEEFTTGAKKFKKNFALKTPKFIFIEPTDRQVMIAQRGVLSATITTHGVAQHASLATVEKNEKQSAIYKMAKAMDILIEDATDIGQEENQLLGTNTQNLGVIKGGTGSNVVPDNCQLTVDRRLLPNRPPDEEIKRIQALLKEKDKSIQFSQVDTAPGFLMDANNSFIQQSLAILRSFYEKAMTAPFVAWSEAGLFAEIGDVIILGPGSLSGQAHKANEYVSAQELFAFVHIYRQIMQEVTF